jgi:hypothetical protein
MYHQVTSFRDGMVVRIEYFTTWPAALRAAGVDPEAARPNEAAPRAQGGPS